MNLNTERIEILLRENEIKREERNKNDIEMPLSSSITSLVSPFSFGILQ